MFRLPSWQGLALALPFLLVACKRKETTPVDAGTDAAPAVSASAPTTSALPPAGRDAGIELAVVEPVEASRQRVTNLEDQRALLGDAGALLVKHFGGARGSFDVQSVPLTAKGRRALYVTDADKPTSDARPIAAVVDASGVVVWSKDRPVAGITPPVGPVAIAAAPLGRVAMAACDPPTSLVALRLWDDDGSPFADFQVINGFESCDALSLLYWPGRGWLVVAARPGSTRGVLVRESGSFEWESVVDLGVRPRPGVAAAASLVVDTPDSFMLVQMGQLAARAEAPLHALAFRYDLRGHSLWESPVDLGALAKTPDKNARAAMSPLHPGARVRLPSGKDVDVRPTGEVTARR